MTPDPAPYTVARHLARRLAELGITHLFGVPGNHLGPFLTTLRAEGSVTWVGTPTEGGAGQAADAYARIHGVGAAAVTYGVGAFNLLNACGGAYVEQVPLIAINASPPYEQWQNYRAIGLLTSHMSPRPEANLDVYRQVTVDARLISNPATAAARIDAALTACLAERRPVYLEIMEDLWDEPCTAPEAPVLRRERPFGVRNEALLRRAVDAVLALIAEHPGPDGRPRPVLWAGEELDRYRLGGRLTDLVTATGVPFCTTVGAKAVVAEDLPQFHGVYNGRASHPDVHRIFKDWATCRIGLGAWSTSKNLGGEQSLGDDWVMAAHGGVSVGTAYFPDVPLAHLLPALQEALTGRYGPGGLAADYYAEDHAHHGAPDDRPAGLEHHRASLRISGAPPGDDPGHLTYDGVFDRINHFLNHGTRQRWTVVSDAAFSLIGSMNLALPAGGFLSQIGWLSIGWSVGAATGAALAPERGRARPMVFVGDGAFQETCQEISTHTRLGLRSVVFVMDNEHFYGIEQMLVHPGYYAGPDAAEPDFYNLLHPWHYDRLAEVFAGERTPATGVTLAHPRELDALLARLDDPADPVNAGPLLVRVRLPRHDYPRAMAYKVRDALPGNSHPRTEQDMADLNVLIAFDAATIVERYPNASTNPEAPTQVDHSLIHMTTRHDRIIGSSGAELNLRAEPGDTIKWRETTISLGSEYKALLYRYVSNDSAHQLIREPEIEVIEGVFPMPKEGSEGKPEFTTQTYQDHYWRTTVKKSGQVVYRFYFQILDRHRQLKGFFQWDPFITIELP